MSKVACSFVVKIRNNADTKGLSKSSKRKATAPFLKNYSQKEKPPSEIDSGKYGNAEVGEKSTSFYST